MHFGEYELFLSLISLSPLPTVHPNTFQRIWVRSSTLCYQSFNLTMGRSLSFASAPSNYIALLRLAFASAASVNRINLATEEQLVGSLCKRHEVTCAPSACKHSVSGTISLPCSGCFSPFPHGTCSLSVSQEYLALPDGPGRFRQDFTCPALLRILLGITFFSFTGLSPSLVAFPSLFY